MNYNKYKEPEMCNRISLDYITRNRLRNRLPIVIVIDWNYFFGKIIVIVIDYGKLFKKRLEEKTITMKKIYYYQK